jgi:hypothetical protein
VQIVFRDVPGAALRLPPAKFRQPSGSKTKARLSLLFLDAGFDSGSSEMTNNGNNPDFECPGGTPEISRWQAKRRHRSTGRIGLSAPAGAADWIGTIVGSGTPAGEHTVVRDVPGAALRLPPANFRQPSGLKTEARSGHPDFGCPGGTGEISLWQAKRGHWFNVQIASSAPAGAMEQNQP